MFDSYPDLAEIVSRDPEVHSGDLVVEDTGVPLEALVDAFEFGESEEEILAGYPSVPPDVLRLLVDVWDRLCQQFGDEAEASQHLLVHADWAWISSRVAREIDAGRPRFSDLFRLEELVGLAERMVREPGGWSRGGTDEPPGLRRLVKMLREMMLRGMQSEEAARAADALFEKGEHGRITGTLHALTDAASSLRTAAGTLDGHRPVHADQARRLADDVDRLTSDLERPSAEP